MENLCLVQDFSRIVRFLVFIFDLGFFTDLNRISLENGCADWTISSYIKHEKFAELEHFLKNIREMREDQFSTFFNFTLKTLDSIGLQSKSAELMEKFSKNIPAAKKEKANLKEESTHVPNKNRDTCPTCNKEVQKDWKVCPFCKTSLPIICPCGRKIEPDWKYCPICGKNI